MLGGVSGGLTMAGSRGSGVEWGIEGSPSQDDVCSFSAQSIRISQYSTSTSSKQSVLSSLTADSAISDHSDLISGSPPINGSSFASASSWSMLVKIGLTPLVHICIDTMRTPRTKAMNSAMPSSSETDWKVSAKHVATMALLSSEETRVARDMSARRFLMARMALRRWVMAAESRLASSCMRSQAARPSMACMR